MANEYDLWLAGIPGIGQRKVASIISACGTARECFYLREEALRYIPLLREDDIQKIIESRRACDLKKPWEALMQSDVRVIRKGEAGYPRRLLALCDAPHLLFYRGKLPGQEHRAVAMVGARECTEYGRDMAKRIAEALALAGVTVISGMARGIDSISHAGAIAGGGETYAVVGSGPDICYPQSGRRLYETLVSRFGVLSEYVPGTIPDRGHFPARNRLISGLSDAVLVIEARERSGSLITADFALEQGKDVYALPGRMTDALSYGTNQLIRQGAYPIISVEELLADLRVNGTPAMRAKDAPLRTLSRTEQQVYGALEILPKGMEELLQKTDLSIPVLSAALDTLIKKHLAEEGFPGSYRRPY